MLICLYLFIYLFIYLYLQDTSLPIPYPLLRKTKTSVTSLLLTPVVKSPFAGQPGTSPDHAGDTKPDVTSCLPLLPPEGERYRAQTSFRSVPG